MKKALCFYDKLAFWSTFGRLRDIDSAQFFGLLFATY